MYDEKGEFYKPERGSGSYPDHLMLSFCGDAKTQIAVSWRTCTDISYGHVYYRKDGSDVVLKAPAVTRQKETDIDISNYHTAVLNNLDPGTKYWYSAGCDEYLSTEFWFETEPEALEKFTFMLITDQQDGRPPIHLPQYDITAKTVRKGLERHPECRFILTAGDNCDNGQNELQWNGMFSAFEGIIEHLPLMMTTGNHDNRGFLSYFPEPCGKYYLEHADFYDFQFKYAFPQNGPEGYETENYAFSYGNVRFAVMGINAPDAVSDWAYNDLKNSGKTWKIGSYHFPIYPLMPEGQNDDGYPWLRKAIESCDLVFEGHDHSFARTYPIKNDEMFDRPSQGTIHYIAGNANGNIYHSNCPKVWHSAFFTQEEKVGLYTIVEVDGNKLTLTSYLTDGRIVDVCIIDKEKDSVFPPALAPVYDKTKMAFKGRMLELSARNAYPEKKNGIWFAPFGVLLCAIGSKVVKEADTLYCEVYGHHALFTLGSRSVRTDLGTVEMCAEPYFFDGQMYVPIDDSAKIFGMSWYYAPRNNYINWNTPTEEKPLCKHPENRS